jgi:ubiquinone/menaquinone biosynthesis C-methylase UbiE
MAESGAEEVVGVDLLDEFTKAKAEAKKRSLTGISFVQSDIRDMGAEQFDVVISHDAFEHFEQPDEMLSEMVRVLRPGGRLMIKFGPPWRNPWGRHMSGTIRRDRPWVHLIVPEKVVMRCHSVYHNEPAIKERYAQLAGGLNKMLVKQFRQLLNRPDELEVVRFDIVPMYQVRWFYSLPESMQEFVASAVSAECIKRVLPNRS